MDKDNKQKNNKKTNEQNKKEVAMIEKLIDKNIDVFKRLAKK